MANGGKRVGAGRPKGSQSEATTLLKSKSKELMLLAIKRAKTSDMILGKLIDKIAATLQHTQLDAEVTSTKLTPKERKERIEALKAKLND